MKKLVCCECGRKREPYRPVVKHLDGTIDVVCRQCCRTLYEEIGVSGTPGYQPGYLEPPSAEDRAVLKRLCHA